MPKGIDLDELEEQAKKLLILLQERGTGIAAWHMFLVERLKEIKKLIEDAGL